MFLFGTVKLSNLIKCRIVLIECICFSAWLKAHGSRHKAHGASSPKQSPCFSRFFVFVLFFLHPAQGSRHMASLSRHTQAQRRLTHCSTLLCLGRPRRVATNSVLADLQLLCINKNLLVSPHKNIE